MPQVTTLVSILEEARGLLAADGNDFSWSSWRDRDAALDEIDMILAELRSGIIPSTLTLNVLFAPTGPIQEVSLSSGWGDAFIQLANRFDDAMANDNRRADANQQLGPHAACACFAAPPTRLISISDLGLDSRLAEVAVLICQDCGQHWLRYFYEVEAFTGSGRWYLGAISPKQLATLTREQAKSMLESLNWYYYGGSYYEGRNGRTSGNIVLSP
jgi:hypothetical protein